LELDDEQILDYLHHLTKQSKSPSLSYFKHTLYGLRFAYKVEGMVTIMTFDNRGPLKRLIGIDHKLLIALKK